MCFFHEEEATDNTINSRGTRALSRVFLFLIRFTATVFIRRKTHDIAQAFKNNRGRLPERHEYLSMLAAFTTK